MDTWARQVIDLSSSPFIACRLLQQAGGEAVACHRGRSRGGPRSCARRQCALALAGQRGHHRGGGTQNNRLNPSWALDPFEGYEEFLRDLKDRIRTAQVRAALAVNRELVMLYCQMGRETSRRMREHAWGAKMVVRLSADLRREFPDMQGFSPRNLRYMRSFAEAWPDEAILQQVAAKLPWFHNCVLLDKTTDTQERLWYALQTIEHGWSRNVLVQQIESKLYERQGKAITNFERALPAPQSDLARQVLKDPYNFDFLTLRSDAEERKLEKGLLEHIRKFLLELGTGCRAWSNWKRS